MEKPGKYIYCIIDTKQERNFGPIGIDGEDVLTIDYDDLSMVVSSHPTQKLVVDRQNMLAHEKVIEAIMKEFDSVLPVRFGTVSSDADEVRNLLDKRYREFKSLLRNMNHKVELGVKGVWKDMNTIFKEIVEGGKEIKRLKGLIQKEKGKKNIQAKMEVGKMVEKVLTIKKEKEAKVIVSAVKDAASDYKLNRTVGDQMFMNASFLVDKGREKEFDNIMDDLSDKHKSRIKFMYAGPLPLFNFVNIIIYPEEWEKSM